MTQSVDLKGALNLLDQVLRRKKSQGHQTISISDEGLTLLQNLPITFMRAASGLAQPSRSVEVKQPVPVSISETKATPQKTAVAFNLKPNDPPPVISLEQPITEKSAPPQSPIQPALAQPQTSPRPQQVPTNPYGDLAVRIEMRGRVEIIHPAGDTVREKLNNLFRLAKKDEVYRRIETLRDQLVFATGNPEAELMFVGEAPGAEEEVEKKPFVGPAGQKLNQIIQAMGLKREDVYISNIVKYRPKKDDGRFQGRTNRKPTPDEIAASLKFIRSEIEVIRPKVIVALGGTAAEGLLEQSGAVSSLRGKFFDLDGIPVSVTYHPSYLVRLEGDPDKELARQEKRKVWEDALFVMEKLGLPISEKQRGFFSK